MVPMNLLAGKNRDADVESRQNGHSKGKGRVR